MAALSAMSRQRGSTENRENLVTLLQREWSRSREPTTRSTPRDHHAVMPQQPSYPLPQAQRRPPVAKMVTNGPVLVFVAGVEGTGHHMLCAALTPRHPHCRAEPCFKVDKRLDALVRQCPNAPMHHACANAPMRHYAMCPCANADTRPRLHSERRAAHPLQELRHTLQQWCDLVAPVLTHRCETLSCLHATHRWSATHDNSESIPKFLTLRLRQQSFNIFHFFIIF